MQEKRNFKIKKLDPSVPEELVNVTALYTAFCYYYTPDFYFKGEFHEPWEFVYVFLGEVVLETEEETFILKAGDAFLHKPREFHRHSANHMVCNACFISFDCSCSRLYELTGHVLRTTHTMQQLIQTIADEGSVYLAGTNWAPPRSKNEVLKYACGQMTKNSMELLLIHLLRQADSEEGRHDDISRNEKTLVQSIQLFLKQNVTQKLSLNDIANSLGYSVSHICYSFKKCLNTSIIQYFMKLRINKAKELIAEGKMSISQISDLLDFDTIQYFSTQFKKIVGFSPSQYATILKNRRIVEAVSNVVIDDLNV